MCIRDSNGTATSALACGGEDAPSNTANTEVWNGTAWTEVNNLNTARRELASGGADSTSSLAFGGENPSGNTVKAVTESWNGTSWTEVNDLNTARNELAGNGVAASALGYGGLPTTAATEEWSDPSFTIKTVDID